MAEAYKVVDIPNRVPNVAVFLEEQRAIEHIAKYGGRLKRLVEDPPATAERPKCRSCGTRFNLHKDPVYGYLCNSSGCTPF